MLRLFEPTEEIEAYRVFSPLANYIFAKTGKRLGLGFGAWFQIPALLLVTSVTFNERFRIFHCNFLMGKTVITPPISQDPPKDLLANVINELKYVRNDH